jgi:hypothetical protein
MALAPVCPAEYSHIIVDCASKDHLDAKIRQFIHTGNHHAHPFNWSTKSGAKVMAAAPALAA